MANSLDLHHPAQQFIAPANAQTIIPPTALNPAPESSLNNSLNDHYHHPTTVEELTEKNIRTVVELEEAAKARRTTADRVADVVSDFCGSMIFVWVHIIWFGGWIAINLFGPKSLHFDKFPFTFLTLVVSLEAIFLSTFILISQNHQTRLSERRNHLDLQINLLTEQENTKMLQMLQRIADKVGVDLKDDPDIAILEKSTRPEEMIDQIDRTVEETVRREKSGEDEAKPASNP